MMFTIVANNKLLKPCLKDRYLDKMLHCHVKLFVEHFG